MPSTPLVRKRIVSSESLDAFLTSHTHDELLAFIERLNAACSNRTLRETVPQNQVVLSLLRLLQAVHSLAEQTPPVDNAHSRFGNPAFREFYDKVDGSSDDLLGTLPGLRQEDVPQLAPYFIECWGNRTRIDYGSGMELNFLCFLFCLDKLGLVGQEDYPALVLRVFWRYIEVMRLLQSTYWLEPAGSHGVWGLDDYHFLPFVFGSSQLRGHKHMSPKSIHDAEIVEEFSNDYMYFACIRFINSIKTASLRWHSPMLDDISSVKTWEKVNGGMLKMFRAEVLGKLPVAQHFLFGPLLPFPGPDEADNETHENGHAVGEAHNGHVHKGIWDDCCGIPVPSAFGAAEASGKPANGQAAPLRLPPGVRRIPFD